MEKKIKYTVITCMIDDFSSSILDHVQKLKNSDGINEIFFSSKHNYMYTIKGRKHLQNILKAFMTTHTHTHKQTNGKEIDTFVPIFFHLNDIY